MDILEDSEELKLLQKFVDESESIVFFGGAGVSTESGIPDFRSVDGLYNQKWAYPPEDILSRNFFYSNPKEFYRFYREKILLEGIEPNKAHYRLAEMEQKGKLKAVITQNIDGLHQKAGSKNVLELHGSVLRNHCVKCNAFYDGSYVTASKGNDGICCCSKDGCGGIIKPDVVLYGEELDDDIVERAIRHIQEADLLIIGGTSLTVYPAAGFVRAFMGNHIVLINKSPTSNDEMADLLIHQSIGEVLGKIKI